ncbi:unnamed protein product [Blepharisma stoltei]|uniref:Uncharacterized protein n=1 Tax=Blepharisma stoltei TaxID=1481888 RepID=A0AAU9JL93_9CILI|nr:unnamed protein product [Blepharisma stoltei]
MDTDISLQSSDNEFWNDLESVPQLTSFHKTTPIDFSYKKSSKASSPPISPSPNSPMRLIRLEKQIDHMRLAKEEEMEALKIIVRNNTRKELQANVEAIIEKFQEETKVMKEGYDGLKIIITNKEKTISQLGEYLSDQAVLISEFRIEKSTEKEASSPAKTSDKFETRELKKEVKLLKVQLDALREVCASCQKDTDEFKKKMMALQEENDAMRRNHNNELETVKREAKTVEDELNDEIDRLKYELTKYKEDVNKELATRDIISIRQKSFINSLQEELKNAKIVLQNPRIRNKLHDRLKDYMEEHQKAMVETIRTPKKTHPGSMTATSRRTQTAWDIKLSRSKGRSFDNDTDEESCLSKAISIRPGSISKRNSIDNHYAVSRLSSL